ncbi:hypothetical protein [Rhizobium sp. PL01]|uniref:hypothetical protein n=1 Tax=Rhizobium sp. PL01 TaxID=3085631 RepID=UPI00298226A3|nr:hypothetical protein [Rhizobium sp. PL01]MDW5314989.1 hypothetical protein [Rhizobium sp. PL01]
MADVLVETGDLTGVQTQLARAIASLIEGFEFADALPAMIAILAGCIIKGADSTSEAATLAEALGEVLVTMVESEPLK